MLDILTGYRSYLTACAAGIVLTAVQLNVITQEQGDQILKVLAIFFGIFMRLALAKVAQTTQLMPAMVKPEVAAAIAADTSVPTGKPTKPS